MGGLYQIPSGEQTGESVRGLITALHHCPMMGSGWKAAVVNEADYMSVSAAQIWLDALERLPPKTIIIFTTNHVGKLPQRFRDRCECFTFESGALLLLPAAQALVDRVWSAETVGGSPAPRLEELGDLTDAGGNLSFRRVLQRLEQYLRSGPAPKPAKVAQTVQAGSGSAPPPQPLADYSGVDWAALADRYWKGERVGSLAKAVGCKPQSLPALLRQHGFPCTAKARRERNIQ
jgi:hypothetical protein